MNDVASPMIELKSSSVYSSRVSGSSLDNDEFIQDFRLSAAGTVSSVSRQTASGSHAPFIRVLRDKQAACVRSMAVYTPISGSTPLLITGGDNGDATVWDLRACTEVRRLKGVHAHRIRGVSVYDPERGVLPENDGATKSAGTGTGLSNKVMVVTASDDKTAAVWDLMNGTLIKHLTGGHRWFIMSAVILMPTFGTAPFVVTSGWDNYSLVWNLGTGKQVMRLASNYANAVSTVLSFVSPQLQTKLGRNLMESAHVPFILTAGFDKIVTIWDGESGQVLRQYTSKHTDIISSAAVFVPVASEVGLFGITGSFDNTAIVWDLLTGDNVRILEGHSDWIMSVAIFRTNSGKPFFAMGLTGCHDGTAMLWDLVHGIAIRKFEGTHKQPITSVQFLPRFPSQGTSSLSAYDPCVINRADYYPVYETSEKTARKGTAGAAGTSTVSAMHAVGTGKTSRTGQATSSTSIEQSMSDTFPLIVASSEDGTVSLWDLEALQSQPLTRPDISLSPAVAVAEDTTELDEFSGEIKKFSTETRQGLVNPGAKDWIVCLRVFAPTDGRRPIILSGSTTGVATAWDLLSGMMIKEFTGEHVADVSGVDVIESLQAKFVAFAASRKGKKTAVSKTTADPSNASMTECKSAEGAALLVVTGGFDGKVVIWDYDTAEVVQVLTGVHTDSVSCVSASAPYGALEYAFAVSASYDATATVWNLHTGAAAHRLTGGHKEGITSVAIFKPRAVNGERVHPLAITGGIDTLTVIWDLVTGTAIRTLSGTHLERIKSVTSYQPQVGGAVVITGGYDKRAVIWDLETGSVKKILANGHRNWVTSVAVVEPGDGGAPFIVTGGFDAMPIIWDYETGKVISRLEGGHSNGIRALAVYTGVPGDAGRYSPLLFSAGHDGTVVKWDSLYPFQALPPKSTVQKMFEMDCGEAVEKKWPRISALSTRFGDPLWSENSQLFIRACLVRRSDFLERFQDALGVSLGRLGDVVPGKSLLRFALETKDLQSVRVILRCWTQNLNKPILRAMHIKVHASLFLPTSEVLLLGDTYPAEFTAFIASLRLIPVEAGVSISAVVDPVTKSAINGCAMDGLLTPHKLFDAAPAGEATRGVPVSLSYVPLQDAAGMRMLHMYMKTSLILGTVEVFDTDIVIYALRFAWKHSGLRVHTLGIITYCAFFVVYTPTILAFEELRNSENASDRGFAWLLQTASFLGVLMVACFTFRKLRHAAQKGNVLQVFQDGWVVINIACVVFALGGLLARYAAAGECHTSRCLLAVTTILLWMRGLYYLRPYRLSGPLVSMVIAIAYDIKVFLLIMAMALVGFAQGFWLLSRRDDGLPFGTINQALLSSFDYMMGNFDTQFQGSISPALSTLLVVVFIVFMIILMLNLLIALMGNTFAQVSAKGLAQWRQEQTSIILDELFLVEDTLVVPPFLYVIMNTGDFEEYTELRDQQDSLSRAQKAAAHVAGAVAAHDAHRAAPVGESGHRETIEHLVAVEKKMTERVGKLEEKLESLMYKLDYIAGKLK